MTYSSEYTRIKLDLDIALDNRMLLTQLEFELTFPDEDYSEYIQIYYKRWVYRYFDKNLNEKWFIEKFQASSHRKQHVLDNYEEFNHFYELHIPILSVDQEIKFRLNKIEGKYIVIENLLSNYGASEVEDLFSKFNEIKSHTITQTCYKSPSNRRVFASVCTENMDKLLHDLHEKTKDTMKFHTFTINKEIKLKTIWLKQRETDLSNLKNILSMLNKQYRTNLTFESKSIDHFIIFLRMVFNYCYYCTKIYESEIEMYFDCGDFHIRENKMQSTIFDRKQKVLTTPKNFSHLIEQTLDHELEYHVIKKSESIFSCSGCQKTFNSTDVTIQHIKNDHPYFIEKLQDEHDLFKKFVKNVDINFIMYLDGIDDNFLPSFAVHESESWAVKYDLPIVYSGKAKN